MYVTVVGRIFTKLNACSRNFHKNSHNECYEKYFNGLVAALGCWWIEGRGLRTKPFFFTS